MWQPHAEVCEHTVLQVTHACGIRVLGTKLAKTVQHQLRHRNSPKQPRCCRSQRRMVPERFKMNCRGGETLMGEGDGNFFDFFELFERRERVDETHVPPWGM